MLDSPLYFGVSSSTSYFTTVPCTDLKTRGRNHNVQRGTRHPTLPEVLNAEFFSFVASEDKQILAARVNGRQVFALLFTIMSFVSILKIVS